MRVLLRIKKKKTIIRFKTAVVTARSLACLIDNLQDLNFSLCIQKTYFQLWPLIKNGFQIVFIALSKILKQELGTILEMKTALKPLD
jgi:hypothetical protein